MAITKYSPLYIKGMETGLVQSRQEFILPDDAYPILENAYVWRERLKRKKGCELLGRLRRVLTGLVIPVSSPSPWSILPLYAALVPALILEPNAMMEPGSLVITIHAGPDVVYRDQGNGTLTSLTAGAFGNVVYRNGNVALTSTIQPIGGFAVTVAFNYFPNLPVMGLLSEELNNINNEKMIAFDTKYAYEFVSPGFQEFIPGTTWTGTDYNFFWPMNYWVTPAPANQKLFWVTNFSGTLGDPIRYTNGSGGSWIDFAPPIDGVVPPNTNRLQQCLAMLPFRGRMVVFNTLEGKTLATSVAFTNRIRWSAVGNPIAETSTLFPNPGDYSPTAWRDDIRGKGGFLDIPTAEAIVSVGFVRDNLVIYCERSTWQLRYTGLSVAPFQIEKVNSELGVESTFSGIQFDTSIVGVGDKGIVECDSYKSERIDIKIPDLVFDFRNSAQGPQRVYGIRDFMDRLAFWTYPYFPNEGASGTYPNRRLVYNYENDSWAIFTDSFTCFGTYQPQTARRWLDYVANPEGTWTRQNLSWVDRPDGLPAIIAGNQQGFVEYIDDTNDSDGPSSNDKTLYIANITGNTSTVTSVNVPNHNMAEGYIIQITDIPTGTPFATSLNNGIFYVSVVDANNFTLWKYTTATGAFNTPQLDPPGTYIGGGLIAIRDNFRIVSKKFNFLDDGQNIQMGFVDVLMNSTESGAVSLNVYLDYNENSPINKYPQNQDPSTTQPDTFFNSVVPTTKATPNTLEGSKYWQRVFCPVRGAFITLEWTLNNEQMTNICQESDVQIDSQILWLRKAGRQLPMGV